MYRGSRDGQIPFDIIPEDQPKYQLSGVQNENRQLTAHKKGMQACDRGSRKAMKDDPNVQLNLQIHKHSSECK